MAQVQNGGNPLFRVTDCADYGSRTIPPQEWVLPNMIPVAELTMLSGDGGLGKSTLCAQIGIACVTGTKLFGKAVRECSVGIFNAEQSEREFSLRLNGVMSRLDGIDYKNIRGLIDMNASDDDASLTRFNPANDKIEATPILGMLEQTIRDHGLECVFIDSLADVFQHNEVNRREVRAFCNHLRRVAHRTGCAIVLIAHPSKSALHGDRKETSGSTAWRNSPRCVLDLSSSKDDEGDSIKNAVTLETVKSNLGPTGDKLELQFHEGAFVLAKSADRVDQAAAADRAKNVFLKLLRQYKEINRPLSDSKNAGNYAPKVFYNDEGSEGVSKKRFEDAMIALLKGGQITADDRPRGNGQTRREIWLAVT